MAESPPFFSFLEFGAIDLERGTRQTWDFRTGTRAYEWLMAARYLNDLIGYRRLSRGLSGMALNELLALYRSEIHHQDDASVNLKKLAGLLAVGSPERRLRFLEFGSTLFGAIDGIDFCKRLLDRFGMEKPLFDTRAVEWFGIDISHLFNEAGAALHGEHHIVTASSFSEKMTGMDIFFAKGVSLLYQVRSTPELMSFLRSARLSVFDYSFSSDKSREHRLGTGKSVFYLDAHEMAAALDGISQRFMVRRSHSAVELERRRVIVDGIFGGAEEVASFIAFDHWMRRGINERCPDRAFSEAMLDGIKSTPEDWVEFRIFLAEHGLAGS